MSRLHFAGFTGDLATSGKSEFFATEGSPASVASPGTGRGTYSMQITGLASGTKMGVDQAWLTTSVDGNDYFIRFYLYVLARPSASNTIAVVGSSSALENISSGRVNLRLQSTGELELRVNTTQKFVSSALSIGTWYRIELRLRRNAATPNAGSDQVEMRIDGSSVFSSSTESIAAPKFFSMGGNRASEAQTQGNWYFADYAVNDSTGSFQTTFPDAGAIVYLRPDGTGSFDEPTATGAGSNWACTDDVVPNNTTDYALMSSNSANWSTSGSRLLMTCTDSTSAGIQSADTINVVGVGVVWSSATAAASTVQPGLKSGGTTVDCGTGRSISLTTDCFLDDVINTATYAAQHQDPGAANWDSTKLDAIEIGARKSAGSANAQVTAVWLAVDFTAAVAGGSTVSNLLLLGVG